MINSKNKMIYETKKKVYYKNKVTRRHETHTHTHTHRSKYTNDAEALTLLFTDLYYSKLNKKKLNKSSACPKIKMMRRRAHDKTYTTPRH